MGKKFMRKMFALVMTLALVMTSGLFVFADSPTVGKVSKVTSSASYTKKELKISWKAVDGATEYKVYVNGKYKTTVKGTSYTLKNMKAGKNYDIQIAAVKNGKEGEKSKPVNKTRSKRWFKPTKNVKASGGKGRTTLTWSKVSGATGYQILEYKNGAWTVVKSVTGSKTRAVINNLKKGSHKYRVRAIKGNYLGILCATKTVKVK